MHIKFGFGNLPNHSFKDDVVQVAAIDGGVQWHALSFTSDQIIKESKIQILSAS